MKCHSQVGPEVTPFLQCSNCVRDLWSKVTDAFILSLSTAAYSPWELLCVWERRFAATQTILEVTIIPGMTLKSWYCWLYLPSCGISGMCHYAWSMQNWDWESSAGPPACWASILPSKPLPQPCACDFSFLVWLVSPHWLMLSVHYWLAFLQQLKKFLPVTQWWCYSSYKIAYLVSGRFWAQLMNGNRNPSVISRNVILFYHNKDWWGHRVIRLIHQQPGSLLLSRAIFMTKWLLFPKNNQSHGEIHGWWLIGFIQWASGVGPTWFSRDKYDCHKS